MPREAPWTELASLFFFVVDVAAVLVDPGAFAVALAITLEHELAALAALTTWAAPEKSHAVESLFCSR